MELYTELLSIKTVIFGRMFISRTDIVRFKQSKKHKRNAMSNMKTRFPEISAAITSYNQEKRMINTAVQL